MFREIFSKIKNRRNFNQALEFSINEHLSDFDYWVNRNLGKAKESIQHAQALYLLGDYDYDLSYRINQASYSCVGIEFGVDDLFENI